MKFMKNTADDLLTLSADNIQIVKWWVDGSYACHDNCKIQTGGTMSMEQGSPYNTSTTQKINTKSSIETKVVTTDDCMPQMMWAKYLLEHQGYSCKHQLQQDNTSAIKLEINGKASSGKKTKHMEVIYFFIKDRIDNEDISVHYCGTHSMVGNFFTKPLHGATFTKFKDLIMGNTKQDFSTESSELIIPDTSSPRSALDDDIQVDANDVRGA